MKTTVVQFAKAHEVDRNKANAVLKFLFERGLITKAGSVAPKGGKGRASIVYEVPETITLNLCVEAPAEAEEVAAAPVQEEAQAEA
jgi:predicted transcriptional regulator